MATAYRWRRSVGGPLGSPLGSPLASPLVAGSPVVGSLWGPTHGPTRPTPASPRTHPQPHPRPGVVPLAPQPQPGPHGPPTPTETDEEYVEMYQDRILSAQASQLYPLMEDLADWLNKTLGELLLLFYRILRYINVCISKIVRVGRGDRVAGSQCAL